MKIYTKTGDSGTTSLVGGSRIAKNDIRLEAYGTVDELNSWLGMILSFGIADEPTARFVRTVQNRLFDLGCALATELDSKWKPAAIGDGDVQAVEAEIDRMDAQLPRHDKFILPDGTQAACSAHVARTVCRRAERIMIAIPVDTYPGQKNCLKYVNRLSDWLFVLARYLNYTAGHAESYWQP